MKDNFSDRSQDVLPSRRSFEKREHKDLEPSTDKELMDLYADVLGDVEQKKVEEKMTAFQNERVPTKEILVSQESPVKNFIQKQYANLSPEKQAILYAAASNPHNIDAFDPEVFTGKVEDANQVASLLGKMGLTKRSQEDTFA